MTTRQEFIYRISAKNPDLRKDDVHFIVSECFEYISEKLALGNRVEIRGFGSFKVNEKRVVSSLVNGSSTLRKTVRYKGSINVGET
jgi:nucleoid DNA-binding protein